MIEYILGMLMIFLGYLFLLLAYVMGFKSLLLLPLFALMLLALYRAFDKHLKKKARRVRADGRSDKSIIAENIIPNTNTACQDKNRSRPKKLRKEVYIYE